MFTMRQAFMMLFMYGVSATLAFAQPDYDLARLEALALESNRALLAARDQLSVAHAALDSAAAFPNPEVEYLSGTLKARNPAGSPGHSTSFSVVQPLDLPVRRSARIAAAEAGMAVTTASVQGFEAELLARVRLSYFELLRREAEVKNAREDVALIEKVQKGIAQRVKAGESPKFELIKAEAETLNAQKTAQMAEIRVQKTRSQLLHSVGYALPVDFKIVGQLQHVPDLPPVDALRKELSARNPDLVRVRAEVDRAQHQLDLERAQRWPNVALKAGIDREPDIKSSKFGVVVSIPLWDQRSGPIGEASAQLLRSKNQLEDQEFSLVKTLEVAYQQCEIARTRITALESSIVKQAEATLKVAEAAYRFGERGFLEVLDAQRVYRAARAELIEARFELASAWVEIEKLRAAPGGKTK